MIGHGAPILIDLAPPPLSGGRRGEQPGRRPENAIRFSGIGLPRRFQPKRPSECAEFPAILGIHIRKRKRSRSARWQIDPREGIREENTSLLEGAKCG